MPTYGSQVSDVSAIFTQMYVPGITRSLLYRLPFYNWFNRDVSRLDPVRGANYARIRYNAGVWTTFAPRVEAANIITPGRMTTSEGRIYPKQLAGGIGWTKEEEEDCRDQEGTADFLSTLSESFIDGARWVLQAGMFGDGTGRLARVVSYNAGTRVVTVDNDIYNFAYWDALGLIRDNMLMDIYTVADIVGTAAWTDKARKVLVDQVNRSAKTFRITVLTDSAGVAVSGSAIDASPADSDYVFLHNAVALTSDNKWSAWNLPPGLMAVVDDAQDAGAEFTESGNAYNHSWYGATIQNIARAGFNPYLSQVWRANDNERGGTAGTKHPTSWDEVMSMVRWLTEENDAGDPGSLIAMANGATVDWMGRVSNQSKNLTKLMEGNEAVLGYSVSDYLIGPKGDRIPVFRIPMFGNGVIQFVNSEDIHRWEVAPLANIPYNPGSGMVFHVPGARNLTFEQWWRIRWATWFYRSDRCGRIEDIDLSYQ